MSASTITTLFDSPLIRISGIACRHPRGGCGCERGGERTHLTLLRRGGFGYHVDGTVVIGDPAMALLYRAGDSYRISHPFDGGDDCTTFEISPELEEEVFGRRLHRHRDLRRAVSGTNQFAHLELHGQLAQGSGDALAIEEAATRLCGSVLHDESEADHGQHLSPAALARVQRVRETLLDDPTEAAGLDALAVLAGCSPFHLARIFRKATGLTLAGYRTSLRIALSLERLAQGESDLSALAHDMGFSHHSHFSSAFRRRVGVAPSVARESMRSARLQRLGRNLIVRPTGAD
jgi:AraC family transcriptional regulator